MKESNILSNRIDQRTITHILILISALPIALIILPTNLTQASKNHQEYIVKPGDTLWQLARSHGCSVETIKKLNRLNSDLIRPNQKLLFPQNPPQHITQSPTSSTNPTGPNPKTSSSSPNQKNTRLTRTNPTLYSLPLNKTSSSSPPPQPTNPRSIPLDPPLNIADTRPIRSASENRSHVQLNKETSQTTIASEPSFDFDQVFNDDILPTTPQPPKIKQPDPTPTSITQKINQSPKHSHSTKTRPILNFSKEKTPTPFIQSPPPHPSPRLHTRLAGRPTEHIRSEVRRIAAQRIRYKGSWRPPGENTPWIMDCSNTTRWLYQRVLGVDIGRTASEQYVNLLNRGRLWTVPKDNQGNPSKAFLDKNLRPGDLLFWEHTYRPVRWPPITHVAIYLGKDEKGRHLMAASNSSGTATRRGGPNIYVFRPEMNFGGYRPIGSHRYRHGRFVAFGRPIDHLDRQTFAGQNKTPNDLFQ